MLVEQPEPSQQFVDLGATVVRGFKPPSQIVSSIEDRAMRCLGLTESGCLARKAFVQFAKLIAKLLAVIFLAYQAR